MAKESVVLLHGLGRTPLAMWPLRFRLTVAGYHVLNCGYPSTLQPIEQLSQVVGQARARCLAEGADIVHFVTHSLGGILVRHYFSHHSAEHVGRVVMLGPPNQGSEVVDQLRDTWWFRLITGPAGQQLGTEPESLPNTLGTPPLEIGVIAGRRSSDPWFKRFFSGSNDGKVSVERARLVGMKDFVVVDAGHTLLASNSDVQQQVLNFLREGCFTHRE